jgi:hypothetical protein
MDGTMTTPRFIAASESWRFGPDWPGCRCGAKTRRGTPCQKPALKTNTRCQIHGGRGGAPSGSANGNYKNGRYIAGDDCDVTWGNKDAAETFYARPWLENIREKFGVEPGIAYFDTPLIVDNESGCIKATS